jgi:hypothetical protein
LLSTPVSHLTGSCPKMLSSQIFLLIFPFQICLLCFVMWILLSVHHLWTSCYDLIFSKKQCLFYYQLIKECLFCKTVSILL